MLYFYLDFCIFLILIVFNFCVFCVYCFVKVLRKDKDFLFFCIGVVLFCYRNNFINKIFIVVTIFFWVVKKFLWVNRLVVNEF